MRLRLSQTECRRLYNEEGQTFETIGAAYRITRQAAWSLYHYTPVPADKKRKPGPRPRP